MTDNALRVWTKTMHRCAQVSDALDELTSRHNPSEKHKETQDDFTKICAWFRSHNPFRVGEKLICLNSGLVNENESPVIVLKILERQ